MGDLLKIYKKMISIRKKTYDTGKSDIILYRIHVCVYKQWGMETEKL